MEQIAVLGPQGTFSDRAAQIFIGGTQSQWEPLYLPSIDDTFHAVGEECQYGIIPIENTLDGYVQRTLDLMRELDVHILQEIIIPVRFALIGNGEGMDEIRRLYVHPVASGQCRRFIDSLDKVELVMTDSNVQSFLRQQEGVEGDAAVVPCHMADQGNGRLRVEDITDCEDNFTRFIAVQSGEFTAPAFSAGQQIRACLFVLPEYDKPGLLYEILKVFYDQHVNLVPVISRPAKTYMGAYNFYIEVNGTQQDKDNILRAMITLKAKFSIKIMGMYSM